MGARPKLSLWGRVSRPILYFVASLAGGAIVASVGSRMLVHNPTLAQVVVFLVGIVAAGGGRWSFWVFAGEISFVRRGYQIRQLPPRQYWRSTPGPKACVYEEWIPDAGIRRLPFVREILTDGYPAPCLVLIPGAAAWDTSVPGWARGRRGEIIERIRECAGGGTQVTEVDSPPNQPLQPTSGATTDTLDY
jgi:hypothetical protein